MESNDPGATCIRAPNDVRTALDVDSLRQGFLDNLYFVQGRHPATATRNDLYLALAYTVRDRMLLRWMNTEQAYVDRGSKVAAYLSAEFLLGPHLGNNLQHLGILETAREVLAPAGIDLDDLLAHEEEPGLGNGGLGRLAACYLDSLATLEIPAIGYGIRYEFGIFDQEIRGGEQIEVTDKWLRHGNPWEVSRPEIAYDVGLGGHTEAVYDDGRYNIRWIPARVVKGVAYDTPILGHRVNTANVLRLFKAEACESFDFQAFNVGDYDRAVEQKVDSETITKVLYPNDEVREGKRLRLEQQHFLVTCALRDAVRLHLRRHDSLEDLADHYAVQMNDTHPSLAVAELMRLLVDEHRFDWEPAWEITRRTLAYTNHTLLPEALETWSESLFREVLPRHLEIVHEVNRRFLDEVAVRFPGDRDRLSRMSIIDDQGERRVRMANLATIGSHAVNGVAELHSELLRTQVLHDFHEMWPDRFTNVTNGVTPRRFLLLANPGLSALITEAIGDDWVRRLEDLRGLEPFADDAAFRARWREAKLVNKRRLATLLRDRTGVAADPESMFDIHVKRIHEYKRQHLNVLRVISLYRRLKDDPGLDVPPRTVIFGGKAAPGYRAAKRIIRLIHGVADVVNRDPALEGRLRVAFLPDFNVKNAEPVYPAADLSEQISTAGKEASGTGNMKFTMNGALTIGTLDGANVEIRREVGEEFFFLFGMTADEVVRRRADGYDPRGEIEQNADLGAALDLLASGTFAGGDPDVFRPLVDDLVHHDPYFVLADFAAYVASQAEVDRAWREPDRWDRMSVLNTAGSGWFSSDRSIHEYAERIWGATAVPIRCGDLD